ncbi:MAG TPA: 50S ribosomal protein L13 [Halanaerobiales bacterium]|nr:50S ribosomal protein L13 [Halanaerobiales bacterium]
MANPEEVDRKWYIVDASGKTLGRFASEVAQILRGKHKATFTPSVDTGDYVIVINAEKIKLTGNKWQEKEYVHHSNYPGGLKTTTYEKLKDKNPELIIKNAVKGMLPHNNLGEKIFKKLKVYSGSEHPHQAQQPEELEL